MLIRVWWFNSRLTLLVKLAIFVPVHGEIGTSRIQLPYKFLNQALVFHYGCSFSSRFRSDVPIHKPYELTLHFLRIPCTNNSECPPHSPPLHTGTWLLLTLHNFQTIGVWRRPVVAIPGKEIRCQWGQFGMRASPYAPPNIEIHLWTHLQCERYHHSTWLFLYLLRIP